VTLTADELRARRAPLANGRRRWLERLARFGMVARAVLIVLIGCLAVALALGAGGKATDSEGAMHTIAGTAWGTAVLVALAVGFGGYALWRFVVAALGEKVEPNADDDVGVGKRLWYAARGCVYAFLAYSAVVLALGGRSSRQSEQEQTAEVMSWPAGRWLVGLVGLALLGWAAGSFYSGATRRFEKDLKTGEMPAAARRWISRTGVVGYFARGVVYALVGLFVAKAALEYDPQEAIGLDGALQRLADQPYGPALLALAAAGLIAYGLFYLARARYREV
jgi:hypothetical protein